jgi:hypothetical protein
MIACVVVATAGLAYAWPADAIDVAPDGTTAAVQGTTLSIVDDVGDANALDVRFNGVWYDIFDDAARLTPGKGCFAPRGRRHYVVCVGEIRDLAIDAGAGSDFVVLSGVKVPVTAAGGPGDDLIEGGRDRDQLDGGEGVDTVVGKAGNDVLRGDDGDDLLKGGTGANSMSGGAGADILDGQIGGNDQLFGGDGPDLLNGGPGDDTLSGGPGSDVLVTGSGKDTAKTGTGADRVFSTTGDTVECNPGDEVRTGGAAPPAGCTALPSTEHVPDAWPPPSPPATGGKAGSASAGTMTSGLTPNVRAAQTAAPDLSIKRVRVLTSPDARKIGFAIAYVDDHDISVRVQTFSDRHRRHRLGHSYLMAVHTRHSVTVKIPRSRSRARSARIRCCFG